MASAYLGSMLMPPVFGLLSDKTGLGAYPFFLIVFAVGIPLAYGFGSRLAKRKNP